MSRHPSPGPSYAHALPSQHSQQMELASLYHPPTVLANPAFQAKMRSKNYPGGITASVEDAKYHAKYKDLKRTVKEIEGDNDRLYFKLLLAKKNIRRMNLERAILYERLAAVPPTPGRHTQDLPPEQDPIFHQQPPLPPDHARFIDPNDPAIAEYMRTRPDARMVLGPDGRVVAIEDILPHPPPGQEARPVQPPHGIPLVYGFRHDSGPGYDPDRQLPPMIPVIPVSAEGVPNIAPPISEHHGGPYPLAQAHGHVHPQSHSHGGSSHHSRSNSARPDLDSLNSRIDVVPQGPAIHGRSPPVAGAEVHGDRSRRHDLHELAHAHGHQLPHPHVQIPTQNMPTSPHSHSPASTRGSDRSTGRIHNHQRVGPGANIHRDRELSQREWEQREYERELERDRERERERELAYRQRLELEEQEEDSIAYMRDNGRVAPAMAHGDSRSGSPNSGPGNGGSRAPSRPDSGQSIQYDAERARPRVSNLLGIERDPAFDERASGATVRGNAGEMSAASADARRRFRGEIEANEEYGGEIRSPGAGGRASSGQDNPLPDGGAGKRRRPSVDEGNANDSESANDRMDEDA
ncbi:hypothetical protein EVJ58_g5795 [Rhodofomes roseus]|uniref:INO80 complex subunit F domain-containing protein n=1 Tax=Rhodofomes roseus TaxID=34475 RepID=A0A4Y9YEV5_9APHY|nr:hypothetical protein EVJ58_g5795 [Rhodofomes roseus]